MYFVQVLWLLTWPLLIVLTYWLSRRALNSFEKKHLTDDNTPEGQTTE